MKKLNCDIDLKQASQRDTSARRSFSLAQRMCLGLLLTLSVLAAPVMAADLSFTGNLPDDDSVLVFGFSTAAPADVTLRTWSYAGGTNANGQTIPAGGFDPILSVFDSNGGKIDANDDGGFEVPDDPVTEARFDTFLELTSLPAGQYMVAVSQFSNFAIGPNISNGFNGSGTNNFVDITGDTRTSAWAFDILNVESASLDDILTPQESRPVPTLNQWMLIVLALLLAGVGSLRMRSVTTRQ